jgi:hypothetical protein
MTTSNAHTGVQGAVPKDQGADGRTLRLAGAIVLAAAGLTFGAWQVYEFMQTREIRSASDTARMVAAGSSMARGGPASGDQPAPAASDGADDGLVREFVESASPQFAAAVDILKQALPAKLAQAGDIALTQDSMRGFVDMAMNKLAAVVKDGLLGVLEPPPQALSKADGDREKVRKEISARMGQMATLLDGAQYDLSRVRVVSLAEGVGMGTKLARGSDEKFASVMRFATSQGTEKDPGGELRVPVRLKGSTSKGDDGEIGLILRRSQDGESWSDGGVNFYLKDPSVLARLMKDRPLPTRQAAPAPQKKVDGAEGGAK